MQRLRVLPSSSRVLKAVADCEAAAAEAATLATADMGGGYRGSPTTAATTTTTAATAATASLPLSQPWGPSPLEVAVAHHNQAVLRAVALAWKELLQHLAFKLGMTPYMAAFRPFPGGGGGGGVENYSLMLPDLKGAIAAGDDDAVYLFKQVRRMRV
jgi:hypothetical protein